MIKKYRKSSAGRLATQFVKRLSAGRLLDRRVPILANGKVDYGGSMSPLPTALQKFVSTKEEAS